MASLKDVIEEGLAKHDPDSKLNKILDGITGINTAIGAMELVVDSLKTDIMQLKADVAEIKFFLEGGPPTPLSTEDQQALDAVTQQTADLAKETSDLQQQVGSINTQP